MLLVVEAIPCGVPLPAGVTAVLSDLDFSLKGAVDALRRTLISDTTARAERVQTCARKAAQLCGARLFPDAVLLPACLRPAERDHRHVVGAACFMWELEKRAVLTAHPAQIEDVPILTFEEKNLLAVRTMRELDAGRRVEGWRKLWELACREEEGTRRDVETRLAASYIAADRVAMPLIASLDDGWRREIDALAKKSPSSEWFQDGALSNAGGGHGSRTGNRRQ